MTATQPGSPPRPSDDYYVDQDYLVPIPVVGPAAPAVMFFYDNVTINRLLRWGRFACFRSRGEPLELAHLRYAYALADAERALDRSPLYPVWTPVGVSHVRKRGRHQLWNASLYRLTGEGPVEVTRRSAISCDGRHSIAGRIAEAELAMLAGVS